MSDPVSSSSAPASPPAAAQSPSSSASLQAVYVQGWAAQPPPVVPADHPLILAKDAAELLVKEARAARELAFGALAEAEEKVLAAEKAFRLAAQFAPTPNAPAANPPKANETK